MNGLKNWKYDAQQKAKEIEEAIESLRWFKWDDSKFVPKDQPDSKSSSFLSDRDDYQQEEKFVHWLYPFIAFITAPSSQKQNSVIEIEYKKTKERQFSAKRKLGVAQTLMGMDPGTEVKQAMENYERYKTRFLIFVRGVERGISKLKKQSSVGRIILN